jgi:hypothetical protein
MFCEWKSVKGRLLRSRPFLTWNIAYFNYRKDIFAMASVFLEKNFREGFCEAKSLLIFLQKK